VVNGYIFHQNVISAGWTGESLAGNQPISWQKLFRPPNMTAITSPWWHGDKIDGLNVSVR